MEHICYSLTTVLKELDIDLIFTEMKHKGFYFPGERAIVINESLLESPDVNFAIAHELSHCLLNHFESNDFYQLSFYNKSKMEKEADLDAIKMLLKSYIEDNQLEKDQINSLKFMEVYGVNSSLYDYVTKSILSYG